jgi:hypothetical protein
VTVGVLTLIAAAEILLFCAAWSLSRDEPGHSVAVLAALLSVAVFAGIARFAPWGYLVRPDAIVVTRLGPPVVISHERIREVRRMDRREIGFAWRVFGSGGFLGWFGVFCSRQLGEFRAYATNRHDLVLITTTSGARIVISPDSPDAFLEAVRGYGAHRSQVPECLWSHKTGSAGHFNGTLRPPAMTLSLETCVPANRAGPEVVPESHSEGWPFSGHPGRCSR